jgi:hypothetical protein
VADEPSEERAGAWPPRGIALSILVSMGAWLFFGSPIGGSGGRGPAPQAVGDWELIPGDRSDAPRCGFAGDWAVLEYRAEAMGRVGEDLSVQPGDRWEFEDGWEAANVLWALAGDPVPGSPQEDMTEAEIAGRMQSAPAHWDENRTGCVVAGEDRQAPQN